MALDHRHERPTAAAGGSHAAPPVPNRQHPSRFGHLAPVDMFQPDAPDVSILRIVIGDFTHPSVRSNAHTPTSLDQLS
jgi:hypothetical protein